MAFDFNPPTPWGVGPGGQTDLPELRQFQSTHSVGSGTAEAEEAIAKIAISIHPLRGEWDVVLAHEHFTGYYFNPPTPWGVGLPRPQRPEGRADISIHPLRGEWDRPVTE